jgi:peptidoglycan hydrolase-like protein with peptidoglycan-binding domain
VRIAQFPLSLKFLEWNWNVKGEVAGRSPYLFFAPVFAPVLCDLVQAPRFLIDSGERSMETLAYLHHHAVYEEPERYELASDWALQSWSSRGPLRLMALATGFSVLLLSNPVWAMLRHGDMDVATLQNDLIRAGYLDQGLATGRFLELTDAAVRQLQRDCGIAVDGIVGPQTQACLHGRLPAPPTGGGVLRRGDRGPEVVALQEDLVRIGYLRSSAITGFFGEQTEWAVIRVQQDCGIRADGVVGPQTRACISSGVAGRPVPPPTTRPIVVEPSVVRPIVVTNPTVINRPTIEVNQVSETRTVVLSDGTVIEVAIR